jgi:2-polyprenyl-6-methoxyphenol hydroxylase-like FAD-dependent oxidoreductase
MAAAWMAQMGVNTIIIDQKSHQTRCGRADGLESRTLEILDSFGLADKVWAQANHTVEIALWVRPSKLSSIAIPLTQPLSCPGRHSRWKAAKAECHREFQAWMVPVP